MIDSFKFAYAFLSNFHPSPIKYQGKIYPTAEHLYQALKTTNKKEREKIRKATTPGTAKRLGRKVQLRSDWEKIKNKVMMYVIKSKFSQNINLEDTLLHTGNHELVEGNVWHDNYWGNCQCGKSSCKKEGLNQLGKILMKRRREVKNGY